MPVSSAVPLFLFVGASLLIGYVAHVVQERTRLSGLTILLACGVLAGPVLGLAQPSDMVGLLAAVAPFGLAVILFEGGLGLAWRDVRTHGPRGVRVALAAWVTTAATVLLAGWLLLDLSLPAALLLGLALAAPGVLATMSILHTVRGPAGARVALTLEASVGNLLSAVGVSAVIGMLVLGASPGEAARILAFKFAVGASVGLLAGVAWSRILHGLTREPHAYALTLAALLVAYAAAEVIDGSGLLAALTFGIVVGNAGTLVVDGGIRRLSTLGREARAHQSELIFVLKSLYFVGLGASIPVAEFTPAAVGGGILLVAAVALARVVAVTGVLGPRRPTDAPGYRAFVTGVMPRGLSTALLAAMPAAAGIAGTQPFAFYSLVVVLGADLITSIGLLAHERRVRGLARAPIGGGETQTAGESSAAR